VGEILCQPHPGRPACHIGLGHADLVIFDGQTVLYAALEADVRSRLALVWKADG